MARRRFRYAGYRKATLAVDEAVIPYKASVEAPVVGTVTIALAATWKPPVEVVPAVTNVGGQYSEVITGGCILRISGHASGLLGYPERSRMRVDTFR